MSVGELVLAICLAILLSQRTESQDVGFHCYQTQQQKIVAVLAHVQWWQLFRQLDYSPPIDVLNNDSFNSIIKWSNWLIPFDYLSKRYTLTFVWFRTNGLSTTLKKTKKHFDLENRGDFFIFGAKYLSLLGYHIFISYSCHVINKVIC